MSEDREVPTVADDIAISAGFWDTYYAECEAIANAAVPPPAIPTEQQNQ
jgi:hypothetical protein